MDHDGNFVDNLADESVDVEKIIETVRKAMSGLNDEERDIIERLYFNDETLSSVARSKKVSYQAIGKRRDKILEKLRKLLEDKF